MSESQEDPSPPSVQWRKHVARPHKHTLEPLHNGHKYAPRIAQPPAPADIAENDTRKIVASAPGERAMQQEGQPVHSEQYNGHQPIEEQKTIKVAIAQSSDLPLRRRSRVSRDMLAVAAYPLRQLLRLRRFSRPLFVVVIVVPLLALLLAGVLEYVQLQLPFDAVYAVTSDSGVVQWQLPGAGSIRPLAVDEHGSLVAETIGQHEQRLVALGNNGRVQWNGFSTPYMISVPLISAHPGSVLVAAGTSLLAGGGQSVQHPLVLYQIHRATGAAIWQRTIVTNSDRSDAAILGADERFVYVAIMQADSQISAVHPAIILDAINEDSGAVTWTVEGPMHVDDVSGDPGKLLIQGTTVYWQVAGTTYAINASNGRIGWHLFIAENNTQALSWEESHMIVAGNALIVARSLEYHVLSIMNGTELWSIANPAQAFNAQPASSGIVASGATIFLSSGGEIDAVNTTTHQILWAQKQLDGIQRVIVSLDGTLLYVVLADSVEGNQPTQALVALDTRNGGVRWTFQPSGQVMFLSILPGGITYTQRVLLATVCLMAQLSCSQPMLYALNPLNGSELWKTGGNSIDNVIISSDGSTILFQKQSSGWLDLLVQLRSP